MSLIHALKADVFRLYGRCNFLLLIKALLLNRPFRVIFFYRMVRAVKKLGILGLPVFFMLRLFHRWAQGAIGFELPLRVEVGAGLLVYHGWALVINDNVKIGSNVTLLHSVTLGGIGNKVPIIEDDVFIGVGAIVLGDVRIGKGARIGAGALILKNVEPHSIVVGNPQRVLRQC